MNFLKSGFSRVARHQQYQYEPRYTEPEKDEKTIEERIKFERGSRLKNVNSLAKHRGPIFSHKAKLTTQRKWKLIFLLTFIFGDVMFLWRNVHKGWPYFIFPILLVIILLVLLIRTNNQR